jgi:hypothetical protein
MVAPACSASAPTTMRPARTRPLALERRSAGQDESDRRSASSTITGNMMALLPTPLSTGEAP